MTESEWLACADPKSMLHHLGSKADKRKCMLFVCACERRLWNEPDCERKKIEVTERYADGRAAAVDVMAALKGSAIPVAASISPLAFGSHLVLMETVPFRTLRQRRFHVNVAVAVLLRGSLSSCWAWSSIPRPPL